MKYFPKRIVKRILKNIWTCISMNFPDEIHFCEICFFPPNVFSSTNHREVTKIFGNHYPEARGSLQFQEFILHEVLMTRQLWLFRVSEKATTLSKSYQNSCTYRYKLWNVFVNLFLFRWNVLIMQHLLSWVHKKLSIWLASEEYIFSIFFERRRKI